MWGLLVVLAVLLLAVASAAAPLFYEAAANAAWRSTADAVPVTARVADAPIVRLNGGAGGRRQMQEQRLNDLRAILGSVSRPWSAGRWARSWSDG
jgi:hypothetical protein